MVSVETMKIATMDALTTESLVSAARGNTATAGAAGGQMAPVPNAKERPTKTIPSSVFDNPSGQLSGAKHERERSRHRTSEHLSRTEEAHHAGELSCHCLDRSIHVRCHSPGHCLWWYVR